jgi:hypothetical protein
MKQRINWANVKTREQAVAAIAYAWNDLDQEMINKLCRSFPNRLAMVEQAHGKTIQPLLRSHKTSVPDGYLADAQQVEPRPWTEEEEAFLDMARRQQNPDFTRLLPVHDTSEIKKRYRLLQICERNKGWDRPVILDFTGLPDQEGQDCSSLRWRHSRAMGGQRAK